MLTKFEVILSKCKGYNCSIGIPTTLTRKLYVKLNTNCNAKISTTTIVQSGKSK